MSQPLFKDVVQIGVIVSDADACVARYRKLLNLQDWHINYVDTKAGKGRNFFNGSKPVTVKAKIAWITIGNVELEIIEPRDEESIYAEFLRDRGPGIHHVMFAVSDYDQCSESMAGNNVAMIGSGELQQTQFQMFDTEKDLGFICEIARGGALIPDEVASS
jgi:methylmalonyl-CoA/ethylmalonyl-CoA epimerase